MLTYMIQYINNISNIYVIALSLIISTWFYVKKLRKLPPGPIGLPYIGYWPFLSNDNCHVELFKLTKKYGDVFSFTVTGNTFIHLGSMKAIKEANILKSDCFRERWRGFNVFMIYLKDAMLFLPREGWTEMRKFYLQHFREKGMNAFRGGDTDDICDLIKDSVKELACSEGESIDFSSFIVRKCSEIMIMALLNNDALTQEEMYEFQKLYGDVLNSMTNKTMILRGNFAKYFIFPFMEGIGKGKKSHKKCQEILYMVLKQRAETFNENNVRDVFDAYINERNNRTSRNDSTAKYFTDKCLVDSLIQIIGDGVLFVASFIMVFFKALLDYPDEQEKIYQEIVDVCGSDRDPKMEDKNKLTYTNAFILEVMRTTEFFPISPSLECSKETTLNGYRIPKGEGTIYNFYSAHMNPADYPEPEKFKPSRFILVDGKRPELITVFGVGKRSCIGEGFTMNQVFLFLTTIVKNFRLSNSEAKKSFASSFEIDHTSHVIELVVQPREKLYD